MTEEFTVAEMTSEIVRVEVMTHHCTVHWSLITFKPLFSFFSLSLHTICVHQCLIATLMHNLSVSCLFSCIPLYSSSGTYVMLSSLFEFEIRQFLSSCNHENVHIRK